MMSKGPTREALIKERDELRQRNSNYYDANSELSTENKNLRKELDAVRTSARHHEVEAARLEGWQQCARELRPGEKDFPNMGNDRACLHEWEGDGPTAVCKKCGALAIHREPWQ